MGNEMDFINDLHFHSAWINVEEAVDDLYYEAKTNEERRIAYLRYKKCAAYFRMVKDTVKDLTNGESFSFKLAHESGHCCLRDYFMFEDLAEFKEEGIRQYMEHGSQEVVDHLEKKGWDFFCGNLVS